MTEVKKMIREKKRVDTAISNLKNIIANVKMDSNGASAVTALNEIIIDLSLVSMYMDDTIVTEQK